MKKISTHLIAVTLLTNLFILKSTPAEALPRIQSKILKNLTAFSFFTCGVVAIDYSLKDYIFKIDLKQTIPDPEENDVLYNKPGFFKISGSVEETDGYKLNGYFSFYRSKMVPTNDDMIFN